MKTKLAILLTAFSFAVIAVGETNETATSSAPASLEAAVAASGWTVQELIAALDLMEAKYNRDVATKSGRTAWHGRVVREAVDTNTLTRVTVYEDGTSFTDPAKVITAKQSVLKANERLPKAVMTNGIPARLAAARIRQAQNAETVSNVTVTVTAGR